MFLLKKDMKFAGVRAEYAEDYKVGLKQVIGCSCL